MFMDLLQSKKFRALLALVILWAKPVHDTLGVPESGLPWITIAFAAFFIAQGFRDLGEELVHAVRVYRDRPAQPPTYPVKMP